MLITRYVHNNIFFSFAVDADLDQLPRKQTSEDISKVESQASSRKSAEKSENKVRQEASTEDESGVESAEKVVTSDVRIEAQLAESEQATYASANNDLKGTKAYQEADVPGLYNLAMAIIDYRGHRVVAQVHVCSLLFSRMHECYNVIGIICIRKARKICYLRLSLFCASSFSRVS